MKRSLWIIMTIVGVFCSTMAFADCIDGVRKPTPTEGAFFQKAQAALKEILPPAPAGWTFTPMRDGTLGSPCNGTPEGGFSITVEAVYTYRPSKDEADRMNAESRKIQVEIDALEKLPPELTKERNELMAKYSEKTRAARQAEQVGNKELARSLYAVREAFGRQSNDVRDKHLASVKLKTDELRKRQKGLFSGSQEVAMKVSANEQYPEKLTPGQGSITVGVVPGPKSPGLKLHGVRTVVKGPSPKREEIISLVDKVKMERVLR